MPRRIGRNPIEGGAWGRGPRRAVYSPLLMSARSATIDARGHSVRLDEPPRRIVSLVPSLTELLAALGLDEEVVGLTRFCIHPPGWKARKTIVGGTKQVAYERVEALRPELVIANREENTRDMVERLDAVAPVFVTDVASVEEALTMIRGVGELVHRREAAGDLARRSGEAFAELPDFEPLRAAYLIWREPYMTVGGDTFVHDVMQRAGLVNVFGEDTRYPVVTLHDVAQAGPDVVLLSSEPYPFAGEHRGEVLAAVPDAAVLLVDGEPFSWYGARLLSTPGYLLRLRRRLDMPC